VELRQLRYFIAVVEERNFSRAALRLRISQPPLSMQVMALEQELGTRLLDRDNRGAVPTSAGVVFYEEARAILGRVESAREKVRDSGNGETGTLAIGFVSIADYGILPTVLKQFRSDHPRVEVQLHELTTDAQQRELRGGRLHLGIALGPVEDPALSFRTLLREELVLAIPAGHRLLPRGDAGVDLRAFAQEDFIVPPRAVAPGLHDLILAACRDSGFFPRITQQARQMQTVVSLVAGGMGVALVPDSLRQLKRTGVRYRGLRGRRHLLDIGVLRLARGDSPAALNFLRILEAAAGLNRHRVRKA
jgi:DNA-binding transcriptional LysR family regulator